MNSYYINVLITSQEIMERKLIQPSFPNQVNNRQIRTQSYHLDSERNTRKETKSLI